MEIKEQLRKESEKWIKKLERINMIAKNKKGEEYKDNILAYLKDSKHFLKEGDFVRGFEAIIWAWAFFEISIDLNLIETN